MSDSDTTTDVSVALDIVVLDCADPKALADFYGRLLGWKTTSVEDDWVTIAGGNDTKLAFQLDPAFQAPTWPEGPRPQMVHLDFEVADLDAGHEHALAVGATATDKPDSPSATFRVYTDPEGHPFCLVRA